MDKSKRMLSVAAAVLLVVTLAAGSVQTAAGAEAGARPDAKETPAACAAAYAKALAGEKAFAEWKNAELKVEPLGPGTHGWLATVVKRGKAVGYLVISAEANGGYRLTEYGTGPYPLFGGAALQAAAPRYGFDARSAARRYAGPMLAAWRVGTKGGETIYLHAVTGERIETLSDDVWERAASALKPKSGGSAEPPAKPLLPAAAAGVAATVLRPEFDPYARMPWLTGKPLAAQEYGQALKAHLTANRELRLVSEPLGPNAYLSVHAVAGYQEWKDGSVMLALHEEGLRLIPLDEVVRHGRLYG